MASWKFFALRADMMIRQIEGASEDEMRPIDRLDMQALIVLKVLSPSSVNSFWHNKATVREGRSTAYFRFSQPHPAGKSASPFSNSPVLKSHRCGCAPSQP